MCLRYIFLKDAENHGEGKNISAYVAILEKNATHDLVLRYHASTPQDSKIILGKTLTRNMKNVRLVWNRIIVK